MIYHVSSGRSSPGWIGWRSIDSCQATRSRISLSMFYITSVAFFPLLTSSAFDAFRRYSKN
ncbi:hypothetical protein BV22DRAFT_120869 [Leucogyrophana mollusca]|uniref:Uncharacterized protein n=1 Tax=Leucogyrophana mollusca TaxID=85980 RepID=A0ACB8BVJ1_9AGAM|nr:hypothetical protein BV22DRAFT_120869 [Leucogyrophana mollusca]